VAKISTKIKEIGMLQSIGKQSVNPCSHGEEEEEGYSGKDLQKTTALSLE